MDSASIYQGMKKFLDEGFNIKEEFDPEKFNNIILKKLTNYFEDKGE